MEKLGQRDTIKSMQQKTCSYQNKTCEFTGKVVVVHQTVNLFQQVKTKDVGFRQEMIRH